MFHWMNLLVMVTVMMTKGKIQFGRFKVQYICEVACEELILFMQEEVGECFLHSNLVTLYCM
jgi:hypothetical protein